MAQKKKIDDKTVIVTVYGTEKSKYLETGKDYEVTKAHAETLIKKGQASAKK